MVQPMSTTPPTDGPAPVLELQRRLLFSLLRPAARFCRTFRIPAAVFEDLARLAYYEELRRRGGLSQAQAAAASEVSLRTVSRLERSLGTEFLAPEDEVELERRVEHLFEADTLDAEQAVARLPDVPANVVQRLLDSLTAAGRLKREGEPPRYANGATFASLVRSDLKARVDGLNHQLDTVLASVRARFFARPQTSDPVAPTIGVARTLSFRLRPEDAPAFAAALVQFVRAQVAEAEEVALAQGGGEACALTFALAPMPEDGAEG
jgi:transcriptional regulator with XRE-family HTH domain